MIAPAGTIAAIGLGSNLEDPPQQLRRAFAELRALPQTTVVAISPLYRSSALLAPGDSTPQPDYCNAVALLQTTLSPQELLEHLRATETAHGRSRKQRWAARTLDLDILVYGDLQVRDQQLSIPHPQLQGRNFVLYPLRDVAPDMFVPGLGQVKDLATRTPATGLAPWRA